MTRSQNVLVMAAGACLALGAAPALALGATETPPTAPTPTTTTPTPPASAPVAGSMKLVLQKVGGTPPFAIVGTKIVVRGVVTPFVAGQKVKVSFYREGRKVLVKRVTIGALANGSGQFHVTFGAANAGGFQARAAHYATSEQAAFAARSRVVHFVNTDLAPGQRGQSVGVLQAELAALHYAVPRSGVLDEATGRALIAYRKMTGLERVASAGRRVFQLLKRGAGSFHVRYRSDGRHVEGDLTRQVLAEIEPGGRVHALYTMSSGKPSTPTVVGRFRVYSKTFGVNTEGMVDSNYFIRGYAIHGYAEVPTYAASHGCLRVPIPDAASIYAWVSYGTPVDVYNESGGGSGKVRSNAGP
jgi:hypothetical protein